MNTADQPKFHRILVTGGAGFLGSNLCRRLVNEGHEVICMDNFFTSSRHNISDLLDKPNFELIRHDVVEPFSIEVDQIYNLACPASPPHYQFNPVKTIKTSVLGAHNVLGLAKRTKARVLQASTSEVYGDPNISPQTEDYWGHVNPIGVRSCYDEGKRCAETLFMDYHRQNGVDIRIVRIFNTYGGGMQYVFALVFFFLTHRLPRLVPMMAEWYRILSCKLCIMRISRFMGKVNKREVFALWRI